MPAAGDWCEMESSKARILIIGATGYIGKRLVNASLALGHPTTLLYRPQIVSDRDKVQMIIDFKMQGATLLQVSLHLIMPFYSASASSIISLDFHSYTCIKESRTIAK